MNSDGSAHGDARFVFPLRFAQSWGALAGVDLVTDYSRGDGIVFQENSSNSGAPPMTLVISPGGKTFTLSWCAFIPSRGYFSVEVTPETSRFASYS